MMAFIFLQLISADIATIGLTALFVIDLILILCGVVVYLVSMVRRFRRPTRTIDEMSQEIADLATRNLELRQQLKNMTTAAHQGHIQNVQRQASIADEALKKEERKEQA